MKTKTNRDLRCTSSRKAELYMDKPFLKEKYMMKYLSGKRIEVINMLF